MIKITGLHRYNLYGGPGSFTVYKKMYYTYNVIYF